MTQNPNRQPFEGVLTFLDVPSDKAPSGARGHRVLLTKRAAETSLDSLVGMGISYRPGWDGHDPQRKIGVITSAHIEDNRIVVSGYLYAKDFSTVVESIVASADKMGMSYEIDSAHVEDMRQEVWSLTKVTFTGAAILHAEKAAYKGTSFKTGKE